jgi:hypothetical protein
LPLVVVLARQTGADPMQRESWQVADHFVLEEAGQWAVLRQPRDLRRGSPSRIFNGDLKAQAGEPYLRLERERLFTCKPGERVADVALRIPAAGRSRLNETIDIAALQAALHQ